MPEKLTRFDITEWLTSDLAISVFLQDAFQTKDAAYIAHALGVVGRVKGMAQVAKATGLSREQLYRSLGPSGNPTLRTTLAVINALGFELLAKAPPRQRERKASRKRKPPLARKKAAPYQRATKTTRPAAKP